QSSRGSQPGVEEGVGVSAPRKPGIEMLVSNVGDRVGLGVAEGNGVTVGGSNVGGGSRVRDGVSVGKGVDGGMVSVGVAASVGSSVTSASTSAVDSCCAGNGSNVIRETRNPKATPRIIRAIVNRREAIA